MIVFYHLNLFTQSRSCYFTDAPVSAHGGTVLPGRAREEEGKTKVVLGVWALNYETRAMASQAQHPELGDASHLISLSLCFYVCK